MLKIKELTIYLQNQGFKYLKKPKNVLNHSEPLYFLQNDEVIIRLSVLGFYPKGYQLRIDFYSMYQTLDESILSYEKDRYSYGSGYIFYEIFYETSEIIEFLGERLISIKEINTSKKLYETLEKIYKYNQCYNQCEFNILANSLIITLNKKFSNYEEVVEGYKILIDINQITIDELKNEDYFKYYYSRNRKHKYKGDEKITKEELIYYDGFKIYKESEVIDLLKDENLEYKRYINLILNNNFSEIFKELEENRTKNELNLSNI